VGESSRALRATGVVGNVTHAAPNVQSTMLTELLAFLDELLSYLESARDVSGEEGRPARKSPALERLTLKTRALRDAVSAERQEH
jgi:hypothetical protein